MSFENGRSFLWMTSFFVLLRFFFLQAFLRFDLAALLERVGSGKESLSFMRRRMRRLTVQWSAAARRLDERLRSQYREQKRVSCHTLSKEGELKVLKYIMGLFVVQ